MFSKLRKHRQAYLCLLFALLLSWGMQLWSGPEMYYGTAAEATTAVPADTWYASADETDAAYETIAATTEWPAEPPVVSISRTHIFLRRMLGIAMILGSIAALLFAAVFTAQDKPYLGPEVEVLLLILLGTFTRQVILFSVQALLLAILFLPMGAILCCLAAWLRHRCSPDWLLLHRAAIMLGGKSTPYRVYPSFQLGSMAVSCLLLAALSRYNVVFVRYNGFRSAILPVYPLYGWLGGCLVGGAWLIVRYQKSTNALLDRIRTSQNSEIADTLFRDAEAQLLSRQQQTEAAIAKAVADERFKVELISNVSHDLRTPLTAILGYGELLEKESLSPAGAEQLEKLNRKSRYMRDLVDSLFDLTKISSGTVEPAMEKLDLIRLLEQTIGLAEDSLQARNLTVRRQYAQNSVPLVTDGARMHQVFMNLLENAIKYAMSGTRIFLRVSDSGSEIQVCLLNTASYEMDFTPEEIVERFARGDKARSTQGSGIGLAIAGTYTESVGGSFRVEIEGDQFRAIVTLPKN